MSDLAAFWFKFFIDAGIPASDAGSYAVSFTENRIYSHMITDLTKENLKELGVKVLGDTIAILKHIEMSKLQEAKNKVLIGSEFIKSQNVTSVKLSANVTPCTTSLTTTTAATTSSARSLLTQQAIHNKIATAVQQEQQHHQQQHHQQHHQQQHHQQQHHHSSHHHQQQQQYPYHQHHHQQQQILPTTLLSKQSTKQQPQQQSSNNNNNNTKTTKSNTDKEKLTVATTTSTNTTTTHSSSSGNTNSNSSSNSNNNNNNTAKSVAKSNITHNSSNSISSGVSSSSNDSCHSNLLPVVSSSAAKREVHNFLDEPSSSVGGAVKLNNNNNNNNSNNNNKRKEDNSTAKTISKAKGSGSVFSRLGKLVEPAVKSGTTLHTSAIMEDLEKEQPGIFSRLGSRNTNNATLQQQPLKRPQKPPQKPKSTTTAANSVKNSNKNNISSSRNVHDDDDDEEEEDDDDEDDDEELEENNGDDDDDYDGRQLGGGDDDEYGDDDDEEEEIDDDDDTSATINQLRQDKSLNQSLTISAGVLSSNSILPAKHRPPSHGLFSPESQNVSNNDISKPLLSRLGKRVNEAVVKPKIKNIKDGYDDAGERVKKNVSSPLNRLVKAELKNIEIEKKPKKLRLVPVSEGIFQKAVSSFKRMNPVKLDPKVGASKSSAAIIVNSSTSNITKVNNNTSKASISARLGKRVITIPQEVTPAKKQKTAAGVFGRLGQKNN